jgi:hypothetical protein
MLLKIITAITKASGYRSVAAIFVLADSNKNIREKSIKFLKEHKTVLLHNGGSCNACTINRSITLLCNSYTE